MVAAAAANAQKRSERPVPWVPLPELSAPSTCAGLDHTHAMSSIAKIAWAVTRWSVTVAGESSERTALRPSQAARPTSGKAIVSGTSTRRASRSLHHATAADANTSMPTIAGHHPVRVLDEYMVLGGGYEPSVAEGPVGAAKPGVGDADDAA